LTAHYENKISEILDIMILPVYKVIKIKNGTVKEVIVNENPKKADEIVW